MHSTLAVLVDRLASRKVIGTNVVKWGCPVPSFGDPSRCRVATLGLNPSNREFMDEAGNELQGLSRRFHTLRSLGLRSWSDADARHLRLILQSCITYFEANPYERWFGKLEQILSGAKVSYYGAAATACHLDLIPYATKAKWTQLTTRQRFSLLAIAGDTLGRLLRDSQVQILILNGSSVVAGFQGMSGSRLDRKQMRTWSLPRRAGHDVAGFSYKGVVERLSGITLGRKLLVLGFNHNLQSSFGVTTGVLDAVGRWISHATLEAIQ